MSGVYDQEGCKFCHEMFSSLSFTLKETMTTALPFPLVSLVQQYPCTFVHQFLAMSKGQPPGTMWRDTDLIDLTW